MTTTIHRTLVINAAFLQEIKDDNRELRERLTQCREAFSSLEISARPSEVMKLLHDLRDQLAMHFALEEAFGYFEDAVREAPQLSCAAESLRQDHARLFQYACRLAELAERLSYSHANHHYHQRLAEAFREFDTDFCLHESRENALIVQALQDDIGVGD